ncbi:NAD(P)-binding protein [Tuber magnatum]|uniref:NAD(P)-binding protein n=1 Tax=Tuber magnatum TaxID=42249 RepID=A0A317SJW0_9PEZI|nr:NAD(P)-binding protein [Tuber magnatum]
MQFTYKSILLFGATSGIGYALSEKFLSEGRKVVLVGRRKDLLEGFIRRYERRYGKEMMGYYVYDVTRSEEIGSWVEKVTKEHPDLDCVFLNSGVQRWFNFAKPSTVSMSLLQSEIATNYSSHIYLTHAFLPFLLGKESASLMYTTSGLALVPLARYPNYCATKAALHQFIISLRLHLKDTGVRVLEIMPPSVQTGLHDEEVQHDFKAGGQLGMPINDFIEETWAMLMEGNAYDEFPVGPAKEWYAAVEPGRKYILSKMPRAPAGYLF